MACIVAREAADIRLGYSTSRGVSAEQRLTAQGQNAQTVPARQR